MMGNVANHMQHSHALFGPSFSRKSTLDLSKGNDMIKTLKTMSNVNIDRFDNERTTRNDLVYNSHLKRNSLARL